MADQRMHVIGYEGGPPLEAGVNWGCAALRVGGDVVNGCSGSRGPNTDEELRAMGVRLLPAPHAVTTLDLVVARPVLVLELAADLVAALDEQGAPSLPLLGPASTEHGPTLAYLLAGPGGLPMLALRALSDVLAVIATETDASAERSARLLEAASIVDCQAPIVRGLKARRRGDELGASLARASMRSDEDRATLERLLAASDEGLRAVLAEAVARG